jgi:NADH:ubiquinone oxidoreductase subunit 4 (subunit M)
MKKTIMETLRSNAPLKEKLNDEEVTKVICVILSLLFILGMGTLGFKFINSLEAQAQQLTKTKKSADQKS